MSNVKIVRPEDVLPDGMDSAAINGKIVRKGTIAAFLANAEVLENDAVSEQEKQAIINLMKELAPAVVAIGLHKHVIFKNQQIEKILVDTELKIIS